MGGHFRIRAATTADLGEIEAIEREVFPDPWSPGMCRSALGGIGLVATVGGIVTAYVFAREMGREGEILNVAVRSEQRRRGIATALMQEMIERLQQIGVTQVYLEVRESAAGARQLYGGLGFRQLARRSGYYRQPPEDALVFVRFVGGSRGPA